jgi:hypothetical protein
MKTLETNWEDEENNRQVAFAVHYTRKDDAIAIQSLTPKQVTFLCPQTSQPLRSIGVWTDKGRQLLAAQLQASGRLAEVEMELHAGLAV